METNNPLKYSRHFLIPDFQQEHQEKLQASKVLVIGAGGLGSPVLLYLAAAGIGHVGLIEQDTVAEHNLQRQVMYRHGQIGESKGQIAAAEIRELNPSCQVSLHETWWGKENAEEIAAGYDVLVDCTDNFESRLLSDEISQKLNIPFVFGAIHEWDGQVSVFNYQGSKSYKELFNFMGSPEKGEPIGVIGFLPGIVGSMQAGEVVKIITGLGEVLANKLLIVSTKDNSYQVLKF